MSRLTGIPAAAIAATLALHPAAFAQLAASPAQYWLQTSAGVGLAGQDDAYFGSAMAAGDFDGDGFDELVIGVPEYDLDGEFDPGLVLVLPGGPFGPTSAGKDLWTQDSPGLLDAEEEGDMFGRALAVGDFNADGYDDLAIGVPYESIESVGEDPIAHAGAVQMLYGSATGLGPVGNQILHQGVDGGAILGAPEQYDRFGSTLAVGDFNSDGYDDLAVGVPFESVGESTPNAGAFHVLWGSAFGITTVGDKLFYLGNNMPGVAASGEYLAWSLVAGDFDPGAPGDEIVAGAPGAWVNGKIGAGAAWLVKNIAGGSSASILHLDVEGMPGEAEANDQFGCALAAGQLDGAGGDDLAITACHRTVGGVDSAGAVFLDYFGSHPTAVVTQNSMPNEDAEAGDLFGQVLATGDVDGNGVDDLLIGVPAEDVGPDDGVGVAHVLWGYGDFGGGYWASTIHQTLSPEEWNDQFGLAMVAGRFSGHSGTDVAFAAPYETLNTDAQAGAVHVLFSDALFVDGFESEDTAPWSFATP